MRLPYAAKTLIKQVQATRKTAKAEPSGDPDGLGVVRSITFDKTSSKWLAPRLLNSDGYIDERIVDADMDAGRLTVTFSDRSAIADQRGAFVLDEADLVHGD